MAPNLYFGLALITEKFPLALDNRDYISVLMIDKWFVEIDKMRLDQHGFQNMRLRLSGARVDANSNNQEFDDSFESIFPFKK